MRVKAILSFLALSIVLLSMLTGSQGCANIMPPTGGPRDSLPPVLLKATPRDSTLHFNSRQITLVFDEYVEIDDYYKNLIISPVPKSMPAVSRKLETISVRLKDDLEPNTTYTLDFGRSVKDVNEGNIYKNFTYIFSTGDYFDSLQFKGKVILAETGGVDSTLTVMLHRSGEDTLLRNEKPRYVTRVNPKGEFHFHNLAPGTYYAYALKDESGSYRYFGGSDVLFAFADSAVVVGSATSDLTLYAYAVKKEKAQDEPVTSSGGSRGGATDKRLKFAVNLLGSQQDLLSPFIFTFQNPVRRFDTTKIRVSTDSSYTPLAGATTWESDSTGRKWSFNPAWKPNTLYHIIMEKDFATDSLGYQLLKADTVSFFSKNTTDYGKLNLQFQNLDLSRHPVLQFIQNNQIVASYPLTAATFTRDLFLPGEYNLRILEDENQNGIWDPGSFFGTRRQPEKVRPLVRTINIKPNLDIPIEIDVNATQEPGTEGGKPGINRRTGTLRINQN